MKKSAKIFGLTSVFLLVLVLAGILVISNETAMAASNVITWRCQGHGTSTSAHFRRGLVVVADELKKRTNGRLVVEPYPVGSFVPAKEIFGAVKRGVLEAGFTSSAYFQSQVPLAAVSNGLPFGLKDTWEAAYFIQVLGMEQMMRDAVAKHGMYYFSDSVNSWELASKKPIRRIEDLKGLKLRSTGTVGKYFGSVGAAPTYLPVPEIYPALATGVVDAAHLGDAIGANSLKLFEICKYLLTTPLLFGASTVWLVNQKAFDKLPEDIQNILRSTLAEHFWKHTFENKYMLQQTYAKIQKEDGVEIITQSPKEFTRMQRPAMKLWDEVAKKSPECAEGVRILKDFNKSLGRL